MVNRVFAFPTPITYLPRIDFPPLQNPVEIPPSRTRKERFLFFSFLLLKVGKWALAILRLRPLLFSGTKAVFFFSRGHIDSFFSSFPCKRLHSSSFVSFFFPSSAFFLSWIKREAFFFLSFQWKSSRSLSSFPKDRRSPRYVNEEMVSIFFSRPRRAFMRFLTVLSFLPPLPPR